MSRTYANFLLFEEVLDNIPTTSPVMTQAVDILLNPMTMVVEEDCNTLLGEIVDTSYELEGLIEVATKDPLTKDRISQLMQAGTYKIGIRNLHTCLSHTRGGICRLCYQGSFIDKVAPGVGNNIAVPNMLIYQTDVIHGTGYSTSFNLSESSDEWYELKVVKDGNVLTEDVDYSLDDDIITFPTAPTLSDIYVVHFLKQNTDPYQGYIARTYSGALLGMEPLPTLKPILRESLYEKQFSDGFLEMLLQEVRNFKAIPETYIDYLDRVHSRMERVLLAMYLFAVYGNVEV